MFMPTSWVTRYVVSATNVVKQTIFDQNCCASVGGPGTTAHYDAAGSSNTAKGRKDAKKVSLSHGSEDDSEP